MTIDGTWLTDWVDTGSLLGTLNRTFEVSMDRTLVEIFDTLVLPLSIRVNQWDQGSVMRNIRSKKLSNSMYNCYIYLIFGVKLLQIGKPTPIFSTERYVANRAAK